MSFIKKFVSGVVAVILLTVVTAQVSYAHHRDQNSAQNIGNGAGSLNSAVATSFDSTIVNQNNVNRETNLISSVADSGGNRVAQNVGNGSIETGDAISKVDISSNSNKNQVSIPCNCESNGNEALNKNNGGNSVNIAASDSVRIRDLVQRNRNNRLNVVDSLSDSGGNIVRRNVGDQKIKTGKAKSMTRIKSNSNLNGILLLP